MAVLSPADAARAGDTEHRGRPARDRVLLVGLGLVVVLAALLRLPHLTDGLPILVRPDEPTVVVRGLAALEGELRPPAFDWPPLSSYVYAAAVAATEALGFAVRGDAGKEYALGRILFLLVALAAVALTGLLGAALARDGRAPPSRRTVRTAAWGAAGALALAYTSVRLSRISHPEHLQMAFMVLAVLAALRFDRTRRAAPLLAAGLLAGLAGATKYLGVTAGLPAFLAVVTWRGTPPARRAIELAVLAGAAVLGFVGGTAGTVLRGEGFVRGFAWQLGHQAGGHLGYELDGPTWWFHLSESLPGAWGWPLTLLAVAGLAAALLRGTRDQRLVAGFVVALFAVLGLSRVAFPHYVLLLLPFLAVFALLALERIGGEARRAGGRPVVLYVVAAIVAASLVGVLADDLRLLRAAGAADTRLLAAERRARWPGPVWFEGHTVPAAAAAPGDRGFYAFGDAPEVLECSCIALVSSYQEQRFRARPDRYAAQVAVYDALREEGDVVEVIAPFAPLSYRWDLLPQWGMSEVPLAGPLEAVGPTITVLDLRSAAGG